MHRCVMHVEHPRVKGHVVFPGRVLYIHCWGGRGRAGTIGAALLARVYGASSDEALNRVQAAFDTRLDNKSRSPETDLQVQLVRAYCHKHVKAQS
jgi:protein-tyrosine phosphatase